MLRKQKIYSIFTLSYMSTDLVSRTINNLQINRELIPITPNMIKIDYYQGNRSNIEILEKNNCIARKDVDD